MDAVGRYLDSFFAASASGNENAMDIVQIPSINTQLHHKNMGNVSLHHRVNNSNIVHELTTIQ